MAISNAAHQVWEKMKLSSSAACWRGQRKIRSLQWPPVQCTRIRVVRCGELVMKLMHRGAFERLDHTAVTECLPCLWIKSRQIHDTYNYKQTHTYIPYKKPTSIINNPQFFGNGLDSFMIFGPLEWWGDPTLCRPGDLVTQRLVAQLISHASGESLSFVVLSILTKNRLLHATTPFHPLVDPWLSFSLKGNHAPGSHSGWFARWSPAHGLWKSPWYNKNNFLQIDALRSETLTLRNLYTEQLLHAVKSQFTSDFDVRPSFRANGLRRAKDLRRGLRATKQNSHFTTHLDVPRCPTRRICAEGHVSMGVRCPLSA